MDLRVKVGIRIRPLTAKERLSGDQECIDIESNQVRVGDRIFTFDHVFGKHGEQEELYSVCVRPLLNQFVKGYNATVLAYGQVLKFNKRQGQEKPIVWAQDWK